MTSLIRVISEPTPKDPFLVIYKPHNLPSAPLLPDDTNNALYEASLLYSQVNDVTGKKQIEKGLIHRLDTVTSGLILIATEQSFYEKMLQVQAEGNFIKYYKAQCNVFKENAEKLGAFPETEINVDVLKCNDIVHTKSYFRGFGQGQKEVRPVTENSGKAALKKLKNQVLYETEIKILGINNKVSVICKISKGYRHQVRCHLAWAGLPVVNDPLYNAYEKGTGDIFFEACSFEFRHPVTGEIKKYSVD